MLTENDVVSASCRYLESQGFIVETSCLTSERGTDIVARNPSTGHTVHVEAKGETSSKEGSSRFGRRFSGSQVFTHVAKAFLKAAKLLSHDDSVKVVIALPDTPQHRREVGAATHAFTRLGIAVWFVAADGQVKLEFTKPAPEGER